MVATAIRLSLQDAAAQPPPVAPPASPPATASGAAWWRSISGLSGSAGRAAARTAEHRAPPRSRSASASSPLRPANEFGGNVSGGSDGNLGSGGNVGGPAPLQALPPVVGHFSGRLQVSSLPANAAAASAGVARNGFDVGAPDAALPQRRWEPQAASSVAEGAGEPLPGKAAADSQQRSDDGGSGADAASQHDSGACGSLRPGSHVGVVHIELGAPAAADTGGAAAAAVGRNNVASPAAGSAETHGEGRGPDAGAADIGVAVGAAAARRSDSGSAREGAAPQARPWWSEDGANGTRRLSRDSPPKAAAGSLAMNRQERPAAERAGAVWRAHCRAGSPCASAHQGQ